MPPEKGPLLKSKGTIHFREMGKGPVPTGHSWILKQNLMVSANSEPTSEIVTDTFLPALLKFGHRCDGTGAAPGRQSHEKAVRRRARAAFFLVLRSATRRFKTGHSKTEFNGGGGGVVREVVGIGRGTFSGNMKVSFQAARSIG